MAFTPRFTVTTNGAITFTGNTLVLSKQNGTLDPGTGDSGGAFITLDSSLQVAGYPFIPGVVGTTQDWTKNSSEAILNIPEDSTVLYAELIWGGMNKSGDNYDVTSFIDNNIEFITDSVTNSIAADFSATVSIVGNIEWYVRAADVTNIVQAYGAGAYSVGMVPAVLNPLDNVNNHAGWTLQVVYSNSDLPIRNMSVYVGAEVVQASTTVNTMISGFNTPSVGIVEGRVLISAQEGAANRTGDKLFFGPDMSSLINLSGPNNPQNNFFSSQMNDDLGNIDTSGSFGTRNHNATLSSNMIAGRQGWDISNIDVSNALINSQTTATIQFMTDGQRFMANGFGIQIDVSAPDLNVIKCVEKLLVSQEERVEYTIIINNEGQEIAEDTILNDLLPSGTSFVEDSFYVNGVHTELDPTFPVAIGDIGIGEEMIITYELMVDSGVFPRVLSNIAEVDYDFSGVSGMDTSNEVFAYVQDGATEQQKLDFLATVLQVFTDNFCNEVMVTVRKVAKVDVGRAVEIIKDQLCTCQNPQVKIADAICRQIRETTKCVKLRCCCDDNIKVDTCNNKK